MIVGSVLGAPGVVGLTDGSKVSVIMSTEFART